MVRRTDVRSDDFDTALSRLSSRSSSDNSTLLNVNEAAALLGISPGSLYHWISERRGIPVVRLSARCIRFRRLDLEAWIERKVVRDGEI